MHEGLTMRLLATLLLGILAAGPAQAQTDPNLEHPTQIVTVKRDGYDISALASHLKDAAGLKYGVAIFPGHPGIMKLREESGRFRFDLGGNFLVRSRRHWLDAETLVAVIDAPSNQWASFSQSFRETPGYGADIEALVRAIGAKFGVSDWTYVGTSEGSISAFHAARMNPNLARRVILTASVFVAGRNGPGLSGIRFDQLGAPLLWVHHEDDPCDFTPYRSAQAFAQQSNSPLITVRGGGPASGAACQARTAHGFIGVERETVLAMRAWMKTGMAAAEVRPQP